MANFGLSDLRLVAPARRLAQSAGQGGGLRRRPRPGERAVFPICARRSPTSASWWRPPRATTTQAKPVLGPEAAAKAIAEKIAGGAQAPAWCSAASAMGLESDEVGARRRHRHLSGRSGLRLAQPRPGRAADGLRGGASSRAAARCPSPCPSSPSRHRASSSHAFFDRLEYELERVEFFRPPEKRPVMSVNLRNIFLRMCADPAGRADARRRHRRAGGPQGAGGGQRAHAGEAVSLRRLIAEADGRRHRAGARPARRRRNPTEAERGVWASLVTDRRLAGRGYKRRVPIGPHIVDFVSFPEKTVLELDDGTEEPAGAARRRAWLAERGYRVVTLPVAGASAEGGAPRDWVSGWSRRWASERSATDSCRSRRRRQGARQR